MNYNYNLIPKIKEASPEIEGPLFYHYRPDKEDRDLNTLLRSEIYCSKIENLNDPFEFAGLDAFELERKYIEKYIIAGVACFCRALTNPLLWAHYANSHKGFVVGYQARNKFFIGENQHNGGIVFDVKYEDVRPSLDRLTAGEFVTQAIMTKATCWAYEQEIRLFYTPGNQCMKVPDETIKEIFFGYRMEQSRIDEIINKVKQTKIKARFSKMELLKEGYGVKPILLK